MKLEEFIDEANEEKVQIYAKQKDNLVIEIENLVLNSTIDLTGYLDNEVIKLDLNNVTCFTINDSKVYALVNDKKYLVKTRLYKIEEMLNSSFIKINQSCIANIKKIKKFSASINGSMNVIFKNGYTDYISRRELKNVKERMGL